MDRRAANIPNSDTNHQRDITTCFTSCTKQHDIQQYISSEHEPKTEICILLNSEIRDKEEDQSRYNQPQITI